MSYQDLDSAAQAFDLLVSTFAQASQSQAHAGNENPVPQAHCLALEIAGYRVHIRSSSQLLHSRLQRPMAHLEVVANAAPPSFTVDLIDATDLHAIPLALPGAAHRSSPEQDTQEYQVGPYLFTLHGDSVLTAFNDAANHTVGIVRDPAHWPIEHYQQALFIVLYQHLIARGFYLIHASAIGRHGKVILFSARSGAGKTTAMLTCVQAGFDFYSDDATLLRRTGDGQIQVVCLMGTMNVTDQTLLWFPELRPHASDAANRTGKRLIMIGDVFPQRVATAGTLQAILAPQIANQARSTVAPMGKMGLLSELLPFSLDLHDPSAAQDHLDFLLEVLNHVPCYRLKLGAEREELPTLLEQILAEQH